VILRMKFGGVDLHFNGGLKP